MFPCLRQQDRGYAAGWCLRAVLYLFKVTRIRAVLLRFAVTLLQRRYEMKKRANYWKKAAAAALTLVFLLSACGASTANKGSASAREDYYSANAPKAAGGSAYEEAVTEEAYSSAYSEDSYDSGSYDEWDEDVEMEAVMDEAAPMAAAGTVDGGSSVSAGTPADTGDGGKQAPPEPEHHCQDPGRSV